MKTTQIQGQHIKNKVKQSKASKYNEKQLKTQGNNENTYLKNKANKQKQGNAKKKQAKQTKTMKSNQTPNQAGKNKRKLCKSSDNNQML